MRRQVASSQLSGTCNLHRTQHYRTVSLRFPEKKITKPINGQEESKEKQGTEPAPTMACI